MPKNISQVADLPPTYVRTVLGFPIVRDVPRCFAYYLKEAFEGRTSGNIGVHLVEGFPLKEFPNVDDAILDISEPKNHTVCGQKITT